MSTTPTTTERAYGPMSWGINPNAPAANEAWAKRMDHAAIVLNRAADVFYAEAGHDSDSRYQAHPTHVVLAAAALATQMDGQGAHPLHDSYGWGYDSACCEEMRELNDVVTGMEWQQIDDLAREMLAAKMLARIVTLAITNAEHPLDEMISGALPEPWDSISGGELRDLAQLASRTALRNVALTNSAAGDQVAND
jgi:hypothetical protein